MTTATTAVEHARDEIVLSHTELFDAHRIAAQTPGRAMTYLTECDRDGYDVAPRTRVKYLEAARFVIACGLLPVYDADKPTPTVTSRTTERVLPAIQTDLDGNRFLDAVSYRFSFVEHPEPGDFEFVPHVVADADPTMDEHEFLRFAADAERFARAITAPVESSWTRGGAA